MTDPMAQIASPRAKGCVSLHERIRTDIRQKILSGAWPPGKRIPVEHELMVAYGCSRMTVSKSLASLTTEGLIERRRRAGSFVARPHMLSAVLDVRDIRAEITSGGHAYGYELLSQATRRASVADRRLLELAKPAQIIAVSCRHLADNSPFALEERLINVTAVPGAAQADFAVDPPGTWLLSHVPWTEAEHRISAASADANLAHRLQVDLGSACLVINRRTWRGPQTITSVRLTYPGPVYELVARFGSR